ncbi:MAG TPA: DMT family transporter [Rubrobacter sp.]|jgi:drug/metabolite transporter (DMT)-like permease|nr:DMT family transporter [Rubrobacter sp.]
MDWVVRESVVAHRVLHSDCGGLLVLVAAGFGGYTVISMLVLGRHSPLAVSTYSLLFGGLIVLVLSTPYSLALGWGSVGVGAWAAVSFSAVFVAAFAFSAWQTGISRIGANRVLVYQYLVTVTGVASGIVFFGEVLRIEMIVGGAMGPVLAAAIAVGAVLLTRFGTRTYVPSADAGRSGAGSP